MTAVRQGGRVPSTNIFASHWPMGTDHLRKAVDPSLPHLHLVPSTLQQRTAIFVWPRVAIFTCNIRRV